MLCYYLIVCVIENGSKSGLPTVLKPIIASNVRLLESNYTGKGKQKYKIGVNKKKLSNNTEASLTSEIVKKEKLTKTQPNPMVKFNKPNKLKLPDDSNYEKIVDFVNDLKVNIVHDSKQKTLFATCRPTKAKDLFVNTKTSTKLINCLFKRDDTVNFESLRKRFHIGNEEGVALFNSLNLPSRDDKPKFAIKEIQYVIDSIIQ